MTAIFSSATKLTVIDGVSKGGKIHHVYFLNCRFPDLKRAMLNYSSQKLPFTFWHILIIPRFITDRRSQNYSKSIKVEKISDQKWDSSSKKGEKTKQRMSQCSWWYIFDRRNCIQNFNSFISKFLLILNGLPNSVSLHLPEYLKVLWCNIHWIWRVIRLVESVMCEKFSCCSCRIGACIGNMNYQLFLFRSLLRKEFREDCHCVKLMKCPSMNQDGLNYAPFGRIATTWNRWGFQKTASICLSVAIILFGWSETFSTEESSELSRR